MLEGPHLLAEALASGVSLEEVLVTPDFLASPAGQDLLPRLLDGLPHPPLEVAPFIVASLADSDSPRGALSVATLPRGGVETLPHRADAVYLFLDGLQDPGNLGALARTAEAAGAAGLALSPGTVHPNHPRALRASAGSLLRLPTAREVTADALERHLAPLSPAWIALAPRGGQDLYNDPPGGTRILALGAEGPGLSDEVAGRARVRLTVPVEPPVESLNATVAAAVVLFELRRRDILTAMEKSMETP